MSANIEIINGDQIGGCITVISTGKARIVIDFGENLPGAEKESEVEFDWKKEKIDAVFFTHYHGDHIGRFMEVPEDVPMYMGKVTYKVMKNIRSARKDWAAVNEMNRRLKSGSINFIEKAKPVTVKDIVVTPYTVDHSAFDAYMFLVEADGTNILHTGDYRDHGHRGRTVKNGVEHNTMLDVIKYHVHRNDRQVDILITEGTMMGERSKDVYFSEKDLQKWATDLMKDNRHVFLKVSSTNVDTLASFYRAARANNIKMYANSYVLEQFRTYRAAGTANNTTMYSFYDAELFPFEEGTDASETLRKLDKMRKEGFIAIVSESETYQKIMDTLQDVNPVLVYSMWEGYIDPKKENCYNKELADFCRKYNAIPKHTSGHAYPSFIAKVITAVNPTQCIWPIHTESRDSFLGLDISDELKAKIKE